MESILTSVKKALGIHEEYDIFDPDIIMHINTTFNILNQLGVGPLYGFMIEDSSNQWDEYISTVNLVMIKTYMYMQVRLMFDPPTSGILMQAMEKRRDELEWRILSEMETGNV